MHHQAMKLKLITGLCLLIWGGFPLAYGNDIKVTNVLLTGQNTSAGINHASNFTLVQFDLSWQNSWRFEDRLSVNNWDAAWVFVKFRMGAANPTFTGVTLTNGSAVVNLPSTAGLRIGMPVVRTAGGSSIPPGTVIASINSATQITLSANITTTASNNQLEFQRIWEHASLHNTGHNPGTGMTAEPGMLTPGAAWDAVTNPVMGVFIYRQAPGRGAVNLPKAQLRWNYRQNGLNDTARVEVQVFAIEMVYVPQGSFFVGAGENNSISFQGSEARTGSTFVQAGIPCEKEAPFRIQSSLPVLQGVDAGSSINNLGMRGNTDLTGTGTATLASGFPTGFGGFYAMKYELSQGQYRDFLNTLTRTQQNTRTATALAIGTTSVTNRFVMSNTAVVTNRNGIRCDATVNANNPIVFYNDLNANGTPNEAADGVWIACNFLSWMDGAAYMDWAGLRPMTELEFEKAARGSGKIFPYENAWGNQNLANQAYTLTSPGTENEVIATNYSNAAGNAAYSTTATAISGPLRVGIFATGSSSRVASGASQWGIMELSGNLREQLVTIGNATGRTYTGLHGDATLSITGNANAANWPGWVSGEVTAATGAGDRGGAWNDPLDDLSISSRVRAVTAPATRTNNLGFRGVRTAACSSAPLPAPTLDMSGASFSTLVPYGSVQTFRVTGSGQFLWVVPDSWDILSGQGTNEINVMVGGLDGQLRVAQVNACGASPETSLALFTGTVCKTGTCATGGTTTEFVGDGCNGIAGKRYRVHTFSTVGTHTLTVSNPLSIEYLIVAGGGGNVNRGGGGGGGFRTGINFTTPGSYIISVGAGGTGSNNGGNSSAFGIISNGGGFGGPSQWASGANGGSGGGGGINCLTCSNTGGGTGNVSVTRPAQGFNGGNGGSDHIGRYSHGGGGGAGGPGISAPGWWAGGDGGPGRLSNIDGKNTWYSGGGRGGGHGGAHGANGIGSGSENFGGGAVGESTGIGGQGVIIIRYIVE